MLNNQMFIRKALRPETLSNLHSPCQGTSGIKNAARGRFWWLGMDAAIVQTRNQCKKCDIRNPSQQSEVWLEEQAATFPFKNKRLGLL